MRLPLRLSLLSLLLASGSISCRDTTADQSDLTGEISGQASRLPNGLGQGFESDTQTLKANCVTGKTVYVGGPTADVTYTQDVSFDQVLDTVSGGLSVGAKINMFDIKGAADFASKQASDEFSSTLTLTSTASVKSAVMEEVTLTPIGKALSKKGKIAESIRKNCGDEFISQINYSAKLFVNTKFRFNSAQDKLEFKGNAKVSLLSIGELGGQIAHLDEKLKKNSSVTITARQIGGNPEELSKILDDSIITCNLAEFDTKCLPMLKAIVKYAREDFPKSLANDPVPTSSKGWAQVLYKTDKYADHPILSGEDVVTLVPSKDTSLITREIELTRTKVYAEYQNQVLDYERASDLLRDFSLNAAQRARVLSIQTATSANRHTLSGIGEACLRTPSTCVSSFATYKTAAKVYDPRGLSVKLCLVPADVSGARFVFSSNAPKVFGTMRLEPNGTISGYKNYNETSWRVEGCILRFYNGNRVATTVFDTMHSVDHLEGNYFQLAGRQHTLKRVK